MVSLCELQWAKKIHQIDLRALCIKGFVRQSEGHQTPESEGELGHGMLGCRWGFGACETWTSEDLAYQFNELIIKFKAKAKLW